MENTPTCKALWYLPLLSGFFIGTSYIPFPPWASLFGFVPLWIFWQQQTTLINVFLGGVITAFVFTMIGFNWVTYTLHEFAHLPWFFAGIGMIVYGLVGHLFVAFAGLFWFLGRQKFQWSERLSLWLMALISILCEANSLDRLRLEFWISLVWREHTRLPLGGSHWLQRFKRSNLIVQSATLFGMATAQGKVWQAYFCLGIGWIYLVKPGRGLA